MTTREVVNELRKRGHKVSVYERKGGGLRITKIDSQRFTGSKGNTRARNIVGSALSTRQKAHTERLLNAPSNVWNKGGWGFKKKTKTPLPQDIKRALAKAQRKWRKNKVEGSGGTITASNVRYQLEHYGREEALHRIIESERYAEGFAYTENVKWLVERIRRASMDSDMYSTEFDDLADYIEEHTETFKEEWINPVLQKLYNKDKSLSEVEVISEIYQIIGGTIPADLE